jgi:hypothetical protein
MLFLIDPQNPTKQKCPVKCDKCGPRVFPMYGIEPEPL